MLMPLLVLNILKSIHIRLGDGALYEIQPYSLKSSWRERVHKKLRRTFLDAARSGKVQTVLQLLCSMAAP